MLKGENSALFPNRNRNKVIELEGIALTAFITLGLSLWSALKTTVLWSFAS